MTTREMNNKYFYTQEKENGKVCKTKILTATVLAAVLGMGAMFSNSEAEAGDIVWRKNSSGNYRGHVWGNVWGNVYCQGGNNFAIHGVVYGNIGVTRNNRWGHIGTLFIGTGGCTGQVNLGGNSSQNNSRVYIDNNTGGNVLAFNLWGANASYAYFQAYTNNANNKSISVQNLYLQNTMISNASCFARRSGNISNTGTLRLTGGAFSSNLTGGGTLVIDPGATVTMQYRVDNRIQLQDNATITIGASNINSGSGIFSSGAGSKVNLNSGTLNNPIVGSAAININNNQTVTAGLSKFGTTTGDWSVGTGATFALTDGTLEKAIANGGTVKLQGATLGGAYVTSGTLEVAKDATFSADYLKGGTNKVDSGAILTLTDGTISKGLQGNGQVVFDGDINVASAIAIGHAELDEEEDEAAYFDMTVAEGKKLTIGDTENAFAINSVTDKISKLKNEGTLDLINGSVGADIYNEKTLNIGSSTTVSGKVYNGEDGTVEISSGTVTGAVDNKGTLTVEAGTSMEGELFNKGTYYFKGGNQSGDVINGHDDYDGVMNIEGGTINADIMNNRRGTINITGGQIAGEIINKGSMNLTGGSVSGSLKVTNTNYMKVGADINLSGAEFTNQGTLDIEKEITLLSNQGGTANVKDATMLSGTDNINNTGGTMNIKSGTLDNMIEGGTINFGDTTQTSSAVTAAAGVIMGDHNNILQGCTLTLSGGTLAKGIDGAGALKIDGDVTANQKITSNLDVTNGNKLTIQTENLSNDTTATVNVDGTMVLNGDGTLNKNIQGSGTVEIKTNHIDLGGALSNENLSLVLQQGTLVNNGKIGTVKDLTIGANATLDLQTKDGGIDNVNVKGNLTGGGSMNLDMNLASAWTSAGGDIDGSSFDKLTVAGNATGIINLGAINVSSVPESMALNSVGYMQVVKANGTNGVSFTTSVTVTSGGAKYDFVDGNDTSTGGTHGAGWLKVTKKRGYTLWEVVNATNNEGDTDNLALVKTFSLFSDFAAGDNEAGAYSKVSGGTFQGTLGTLSNGTGTSSSRELTIAGNGYDYNGSQTKEVTGITVGSGQTLNLVNIDEIKYWKDYVVTNNGGTVNIDKVNTIGSDIKNESGTVNFNNGNIALDGKVTGDGKTVIAGANVTLGSESKIDQDTLQITGGSLIAGASQLDLEQDITNHGTLVLTGGTLESAVGGNGTTQIGNGTALQTVEVDAEITQNIKVAEKAIMKTNADNLQGTAMENKGTVEFISGGTLSKAIYSTGVTVSDGKVVGGGNVIIGSSVILTTTGTAALGEQSVTNKGTLDSSGMSLSVGNLAMVEGSKIDLSGDDKEPGQILTVNGELSGTGELKMDAKFIGSSETGSLSYYGDSIRVKGSVKEGTVLKLTNMNVLGNLDGWSMGQSVSVDIVTADNSVNLNELTFDDTSFRNDVFKYVGVQNENNPGQITFTKYFGLKLSDIVQNKVDSEPGGTGKLAGNLMYDSAWTDDDGTGTLVFHKDKQVYAIASEDYKVDADLGEFGNLTSTDSDKGPDDNDRTPARYLIIVGNNHNFDGGGYKGITVRSGDELVLRSMKEVKNFNGDVVTNQAGGTLEFKASTKKAGSIISSGIHNEGTMNTIGKIMLNAPITDNLSARTGTMTIAEDSEFTIGSGSITQKSLILKENAVLNAGASQLNTTEGITTSNASIVNLTGGTLGSKITGTGKLYIMGNVSTNADYLDVGNTTDEVPSIVVGINDTLRLTAGAVNKKIQNDGTVEFAGANLGGPYIGSGTLKFLQNATVLKAGDILTDANIVELGVNLTIKSDDTDPDKNVLNKAITGEGNIIIDGNVEATVDNFGNTGTLTVNQGKELTLTAGSLEREIVNHGTVVLREASLGGRFVDSGTLLFAEDSYISDIAYLGNAVNKVASGKNLMVAQGEDIGNLTGQKIINEGNDSTVILSGTFEMQKEVFSARAGLYVEGGVLRVEDSTASMDESETAGSSSGMNSIKSTLTLSGLTNGDVGKTYVLVDGSAKLEGSWLTPGKFTKDDNKGIKGTRLKEFTITCENGKLMITIDEMGVDFVALNSKSAGIRTSAFGVGTKMSEVLDGGVATFIDSVSNMEDSHGTEKAAESFNAVTNVGAEAAVEHGTIGVMGLMGEALVDNLGILGRPVAGSGARTGLRKVAADAKDAGKIDTVERGSADAVMPSQYKEKVYDKQVWASFMHNKEHIDGLQLDGVEQHGSAQYNGTMVGCDLWSGTKSFGGIALTYAKGDVNSSAGLTSTKNEVDYYGISVYNRVDNGNNALITDIGFLRSENEISQKSGTNDITADANINALSAGVRMEQIISIGKSNLVPFAGVRYMYIRNKDYTSKINGAEGMSYSPDNQNIVIPEVGIGWNGDFEIPNSAWTFRPHIQGGYVWNLGDRHTENTVMFGGASDTIGYDVMDKSSYYVRVGMELVKRNITFGAFYKYQKGDTISNSKWNFNVNFAF